MGGPRVKALSLFDKGILGRAAVDSFKKLAPQHLYKNPVMFVVEVGSVLCTVLWIRDLVSPSSIPPLPSWFHGAADAWQATWLWFTGSVTVWLWFTVVFANFAEAVAEGRGKAQAATLRKMRQGDDGPQTRGRT